jgi:hypothetical protein
MREERYRERMRVREAIICQQSIVVLREPSLVIHGNRDKKKFE